MSDEASARLRLFEVKYVRRMLVVAADEDAAWDVAHDHADADPNDSDPEEPRDVDDVTERYASMGVETGKRLLGLVPDGDNAGRLAVAAMLARGMLDTKPAG